jgi:hypothetical protein
MSYARRWGRPMNRSPIGLRAEDVTESRIEVCRCSTSCCCASCGIASPERPTSLVEGNRYDTSIAAAVIEAKWAIYLPIYGSDPMPPPHSMTPRGSFRAVKNCGGVSDLRTLGLPSHRGWLRLVRLGNCFTLILRWSFRNRRFTAYRSLFQLRQGMIACGLSSTLGSNSNVLTTLYAGSMTTGFLGSWTRLPRQDGQ